MSLLIYLCPLTEFYSAKSFTVSADTGLQYASVSGDYNPHHLYPWTARVVGYKLPMVHGMWTLSKVLAAIHESEYTMSENSVDIKPS